MISQELYKYKLSAARKEIVVMKTLIVSMIVLTSLSAATSAFAQNKATPGDEGVGAGGGGFANRIPRELIQAASQELVEKIQFCGSSPYFSSPMSEATVKEALQNIKISENTTRYRDGKELILDYDFTNKRIEVLKGFFDRFALLKDSIRTLLMHEAAHLINIIDDDEAEEFAQDSLARMLGNQYWFHFNGKKQKISRDSYGNLSLQDKEASIKCGILNGNRIESGSVSYELFSNPAECNSWVEKMQQLGTVPFTVFGTVSAKNGQYTIYNVHADQKMRVQYPILNDCKNATITVFVQGGNASMKEVFIELGSGNSSFGDKSNIKLLNLQESGSGNTQKSVTVSCETLKKYGYISFGAWQHHQSHAQWGMTIQADQQSPNVLGTFPLTVYNKGAKGAFSLF